MQADEPPLELLFIGEGQEVMSGCSGRSGVPGRDPPPIPLPPMKSDSTLPSEYAEDPMTARESF